VPAEAFRESDIPSTRSGLSAISFEESREGRAGDAALDDEIAAGKSPPLIGLLPVSM
jgi:hypothetical protein